MDEVVGWMHKMDGMTMIYGDNNNHHHQSNHRHDLQHVKGRHSIRNLDDQPTIGVSIDGRMISVVDKDESAVRSMVHVVILIQEMLPDGIMTTTTTTTIIITVIGISNHHHHNSTTTTVTTITFV